MRSAHSEQALALELEEVAGDDLLLLGQQLGHVPVEVDEAAAEPGGAFAGEVDDGVAGEFLLVAEVFFFRVFWLVNGKVMYSWGVFWSGYIRWKSSGMRLARGVSIPAG